MSILTRVCLFLVLNVDSISIFFFFKGGVIHRVGCCVFLDDLLMFHQGAAADAEAKSEELGRAVEELHKLLKEAGEGERRDALCSLTVTQVQD